MKPKIWINKARSFSEAKQFDDSYYLSLSASERLETVQLLRDECSKLKKGRNYESGKRLRRVLKIIKQT
jgi:hypothetical protein